MTTKPPMNTPVDLCAEFPRSEQDRSIIYCNAASTGPLPARTIAVLDEWNRLRAEPWRITFEQQFEASATARSLCARLIGADAEEIALVPNTSSGINIATQILPVAQDKVVLGHDGEFPANVYPWMALEQSGGARLEQLALLPNGLPDWEALTDRLDRGDVGVVAISWVSFVSGDRADLMRIGALCRERGIWFVVDGIQGVGTTSLDVRACNIDVLACGAQKWLLSPWGSGFCYVRRELVAELAPRSVGWLGLKHSHDFTRMLDYDLSYVDDARKFEFAATGYQDIAGMNESVGMLTEVGLTEVADRIHSLAGQLLDGIALMRDKTLLTPRAADSRAGVVSFLVASSEAVSARLTDAGVIHSVRGGGVVRLAPHIYNTAEEMALILSALDS